MAEDQIVESLTVGDFESRAARKGGGAYTLIAMSNSHLSPKEISARWDLHLETIRRLIRAGKLPAMRFGRLIRVRLADLEAFENSQSTPNK